MEQPTAVLDRATKALGSTAAAKRPRRRRVRARVHTMERATAALKAYNPDQPRAAPGVYSPHGGEFTGSAGGGGSGGEHGDIKSGTPYATKLLEARGKLNEAIRQRDALRREGVSEADTKLLNAHVQVKQAKDAIEGLWSLRQQALQRQTQTVRPAATEGVAYGASPAPAASPAELSQRATEFLRQNETSAEAAARRQREAAQRQQDFQARERLRTSLGGAEGVTSEEAQHLQQQLEQFRARAESTDFQSELRARTEPQRARSLTNSLLNLTGRSARSMVGLNAAIASIAAAHKARKAGDYAKAGMHLMHLKEDLASLRKEIAGLPKDAVALHTELTKLMASMKSTLGATFSRLQRSRTRKS